MQIEPEYDFCEVIFSGMLLKAQSEQCCGCGLRLSVNQSMQIMQTKLALGAMPPQAFASLWFSEATLRVWLALWLLQLLSTAVETLASENSCNPLLEWHDSSIPEQSPPTALCLCF